MMINRYNGKEEGPVRPTWSELEDNVAVGMFNLCLRTSHTLISMLHEDLDTVYRSSAGYTIYCMLRLGSGFDIIF